MKKASKHIVALVLITIVLCQIIVIHVVVSDIFELKDEKLPRAEKKHHKAYNALKKISMFRNEGEGQDYSTEGAPESTLFQELARLAGISDKPHFRQWPVRRGADGKSEVITEIRAYGVTPEGMFKFLKSVEDLNGVGWIKNLTISQRKGKKDTYYLKFLYSTPSSEKAD